jgi:hypothetical protein
MAADHLLAIAITERDENSDILVTWSYPSTEPEQEAIMIARSGLQEDAKPPGFAFSRFKNIWYYCAGAECTLPKVNAVSLCILAKDYDPEKYKTLLQLLTTVYANSGDTIKVLQGYLAVFTTGVFDAAGVGKFSLADHDSRRALLATPLKELVTRFDVEVILIWTAVLLKKRVLVYSDNLQLLLHVIRSFPVLVWHRQNWNILRPYIVGEAFEVEELQNAGVYCAGVLDSNFGNREELFDIFVDIPGETITVADHAKTFFGMTSIHKDIANFLVEAAGSQPDQAVVKELALKTRELLNKLQSLATESDGKQIVTSEALEAAGLPAPMQRFLFNVASAEGMTVI